MFTGFVSVLSGTRKASAYSVAVCFTYCFYSKIYYMKTSVLIICTILCFASSCSRTGKAKSQYLSNNCLLTTDRSGNPMLWGHCTIQSLQEKPFAQWYSQQFSSYYPDTVLLKTLNTHTVKLDIYMGTWCGDSKREVPRMMNILGVMGIPAENIRLFTVNNRDSSYKQTPGREAATANIFRVPTFIFYGAQGKELGRIIESPVQTLEKDMAAILRGEPSTPHYTRVNRLLEFCRVSAQKEFTEKVGTEIGKIQDSSFASHILNNLVYVLMAGGKPDRAAVLADINESLFPGDVNAMLGKTRYLRYAGKNREAADYCRKILLKDPGNALAKEILTSLTI